MAGRRIEHKPSLIVEHHQSLVGVPTTVDDREVTQYFVEEAVADSATPDDITQEALGVIGAWRDLDWVEMEAALFDIRHENTPTPPIDLLDR
jgi:hypothetical protein